MANSDPQVPVKLNQKHQLAALLEARGEMDIKEIAEAVGLTPQRLGMIRQRTPAYKILVEKYRQELVDRTLDESAKLLASFNEDAPHAFKSLASIHKDTGAREGARVAAAKEILERASIAPRKRIDSGSGESGVHIHLGEVHLSRIRDVLEETEDNETLDLLEGEYTVEDTPTEEPKAIEAKEAP